MDGYAVSSFPFETWAREVQDLLSARGIPSDMNYAGPRAFQVLVSDEDGDRAGEVLSELGYLACPVAGGVGLSGVLDWRDPEALEEEHIKTLIESFVETNVNDLADASAAQAWSTPGDEILDRYGEVIIIADFGKYVAVNGDLVDKVEWPGPDWEETRAGGRVPSTEEHVNIETLERMTYEQIKRLRPREATRKMVADVVKEIYRDAVEIPVSVSGQTIVYAKEKD